MEITNYVKASGSFLKAEDIKTNPTTAFLIKSEGVMNISEKFGNERLHIEGTFGKDEKIFDCSKTNARAISEKIGADTTKWIGRSIIFDTYKSKASDGKLVEVINVTDVK